MSLQTTHSQAVTVTHWTYTEDSLGNKERSASSTAVYPGRLVQTDAREIQVGQATEISNWKVSVAPEAVMDAEDQVTVDGQTFEIIGKPAVKRTPIGPQRVVANLRLVV